MAAFSSSALLSSAISIVEDEAEAVRARLETLPLLWPLPRAVLPLVGDCCSSGAYLSLRTRLVNFCRRLKLERLELLLRMADGPALEFVEVDRLRDALVRAVVAGDCSSESMTMAFLYDPADPLAEAPLLIVVSAGRLRLTPAADELPEVWRECLFSTS